MKISYILPSATIKKDMTKITLKENQKDNRFVESKDKATSLVVGIEKRKDMTQRKLHILMRKIIAAAHTHKIKKITISFSEFSFPQLRMNSEELAELLTINFEMANFQFTHYKTPPKEGWDEVEEVYLVGQKNPSIEKGVAKGQIIAKNVNATRVLANTPGGDMTPSILALAAKNAIKRLGVKVKILDEEEMKKIGMGGILGVGKGSSEKPQFIILEYYGKKIGKPIVLVGKGVTFDSGGLNIKPGESMADMNMDMSGGAAVIHAIAAAAALKMKKNIVALIPAVENMPSGSSFRPGDILKTLSGKTIEVLNTDAEGRIILADALTFAKKFNPRLVIDVATLTGAALVALGQRATALFTKDERLEKLFRQTGEEAGDYVWPLPLWDEYDEDIKGTFGDVANISKTRYGGAITAAAFLKQFADTYPWVHLDIAPRMTSIEGEYLAKGAIGAPVRLLIKILEKF